MYAGAVPGHRSVAPQPSQERIVSQSAGPGAAFFDVDNTLMRGASIYYFARGLAARDLFTTRDLMRFAWGQAVFRITGMERPDHLDAARDAALAFVAGHDVDDLVELCEEIYDESMADRVWEGARSLIQGHLNVGRPIWLVTATPVELAQIIQRRLGLTGALGTEAETIDGVYTGRLNGDLLHGRAKAEAVRALAHKKGWDLAACSAYSDSSNDLPLLSLVGDPHAVNPDGDLRRHARTRQWPVHDFRKHRTAMKMAVPAALAGVVVGASTIRATRRRRTGR